MSYDRVDWRDPSVARTQVMRDLDSYAWAPRAANRFTNALALAVILGLLPVSIAVWRNWL